MGLEQSKAEAIKENWEPIGEILDQTPGTPTLVRSLLRSHMVGELYQLEMDNTNIQQEIATYKERRINCHNIVGLYDFEITKAFLGCARNASLYRIIVERIPYRLSHFHNLQHSEIIYIFHQTLNGYNQLSKYKRVCYPDTDMIGIKENGEIKVWSNSNLAQNLYRRAKSQSSSIYSLWSAIKTRCCHSDKLNHLNLEIDRLAPFQFQKIINLLRVSSSRQIVEGKFKLENRIKSKFFNGPSNQYQSFSRPRAHSQTLTKPFTPFSLSLPPPQQQSLNKSQFYPHFYTERHKNLHQNNNQRKPIRPMSVSKVYENRYSLQNPLKISSVTRKSINVNFMNSSASPKKSNYNNESINRSGFGFLSPTPVTLQNQNWVNTKFKEKDKNQSGKINFSYTRSNRKKNDYNQPQLIGTISSWKDNQNILNKNKIVIDGRNTQYTHNRNFQYNGINKQQNQQKKIHLIGKQTIIQPFQLELKLQNVIAKQGKRETIETSMDLEERQNIGNKKWENSSPIRIFNSGESIRYQQKDPKMILETDRDTLLETNREEVVNSGSKQVAEEFKYYLRQSEVYEQQIEEYPEKESQRQEQQELKGFLSIPEKQRQIMDAESNSRCIIQRWDEEESFYS